MIYTEELLVLLRLIIAHLITDFVIQPSSWVNDRRERKWRSAKLYWHAGITAIIAYLLSGLWANPWLPLTIFFTHLAIDLWKSYQPNKVKSFLIDQGLHFLVLLMLWSMIFDKWQLLWTLLVQTLTNIKILLIIAGYIATAWPLGMLIGIVTEKWRNEADVNREGLAKAGMWIGLLERFLILTFILIDQFTAVGLLIAAKSILRFSDKENTQKKTEYVLIGTLMSFSVSFVIGLLIKKLL